MSVIKKRERKNKGKTGSNAGPEHTQAITEIMGSEPGQCVKAFPPDPDPYQAWRVQVHSAEWESVFSPLSPASLGVIKIAKK